jgi:hypothetical protein
MSYTGRDISDIRQALIDKIPELTDKWTDYEESDLGMVLIELIAGAQDMQNFYFDTQAFETYLDTAEQPKNIRALLRSMNYRIPLVGSAKGEVHIEYKDDTFRTVDFPRYFKFQASASQINYVTTEPVRKSISDGKVTLPVMEGDYKEKRMTRKDFMANTTALGNISRRIYLDSTAVADGSVDIVQDGYVWEEVDDAFLEYEGGRYYSLHRDYDGNIYVLMSVNFMDLIPQSMTEEIVFKYVESHGLAGVVKAGEIDSIIDERMNNEGIWASEMSSISNSINTYGAYNEPTIDDLKRMKILARRQARTMGRYITLDDYLNGVETEPYIHKCKVADWKTLELVTEPYKVKIWAVDWLGNSLGEQDKATLLSKFESSGVSTVNVEVATTEVVEFDIHVQITLRTKSSTEAQKVCDTVKDQLLEYYSLDNMDYGSNISISLIYSRVKVMSSYIKDVLVLSPTEDVEVGLVQFPKLGKVTVEAVDKFD